MQNQPTSMQVISFFKNEGHGFNLPIDIKSGLERLMAEDGGSAEGAAIELPDLLRAGTLLDAIFIAVDEQHGPVGMCIAERDNGEWSLSLAFVTESFRRRRVFSDIMATIKKEASERGIHSLYGLPSSVAPDYWRLALSRWGFRELRGRYDEWRVQLRKIER